MKTISIFRLSKQLSALGLVEVLVVLAIVATTMVAATQLSVQSLIKIKEDEIADFATGRMIQAMEIVKSPTLVKVSKTLGTFASYEGTYRIEISGESDEATLFQESEQLEESEDCSRTDSYFVESPEIDQFTSPIVCLQILIEDETPEILDENDVFYNITSRVIYKLSESDEVIINEYSGYRRDEFVQVSQ